MVAAGYGRSLRAVSSSEVDPSLQPPAIARRKHMKRLRKKIVVDRSNEAGTPVIVEDALHVLVKGDAASKASRSVEDKIRVFSLVLCVRSMDLDALTRGREVAAYMANQLFAEQRRSGYLANECTKMLNVRERWLAEVTRTGVSEDPGVPDHNQLTLQMQMSSSLARDISAIYYDLCESGMSLRSFNRFTPVAINLDGPAFCSGDGFEINPHEAVRPFETILLLEPVEEILAAIPRISSRTFAHFLEHCQPTKSMQRTWVESGLPLDVVQRLAAHLIRWRKARRIKVVQANSLLSLNEDMTIDAMLDYQGEFAHRFRGVGYLFVLHLFGDYLRPVERRGAAAPGSSSARDDGAAGHGLRSVGALMRSVPVSLQKDFLSLVVWLLTRNILRARSVYYVAFAAALDAPEEPGEAAAAAAATGLSHSRVSWLTSTTTAAAWRLDDAARNRHRQRTERILDALEDGSEVFRVFRRVSPWMNGCHSIEEIMYLEGVSRDDLLAVTANYAEHVMSFVR